MTAMKYTNTKKLVTVKKLAANKQFVAFKEFLTFKEFVATQEFGAVKFYLADLAAMNAMTPLEAQSLLLQFTVRAMWICGMIV